MKKIFSIIFIFIFFALPVYAFPTDIQIQTLINQQIPAASVGFILRDAKTGETFSQYQSVKNFYPASNTKLFTAAAALKQFGPDYQFQTSLHASTLPVKGIVTGNVALVFQGDPALTSNDLFNLIKFLSLSGIKQIKGNFIVDDQSFSGASHAPGWAWDSMQWAFSAPSQAIILNENKIRLAMVKNEKLGSLIGFKQLEKFPAYSLKNHVISVSNTDAEHKCEINARMHKDSIILNGCWPMEKTPYVLELAIDDSRELAKKLITQYLNQLHIKLNGNIVFQTAPKMPTLTIKKSPPLKTILVKVLAESNNISTESLTKALGLALTGSGSFKTGTVAIQKILDQFNNPHLNNLHLSDGSGLSRYNVLTPFQISELLLLMAHDPQFAFFHDALSVNGVKGSLLGRLTQPNVKGKIIAKTGTATGVSALSGYIHDNTGKEYIFSLMINNANSSTAKLKTFEDKLCQLIISGEGGEHAKGNL